MARMSAPASACARMNAFSAGEGVTLGSGPGIRRADREPGETVGWVREAVERMWAEAVSSIRLLVVVWGFGSGAEVVAESWWAEEM